MVFLSEFIAFIEHVVLFANAAGDIARAAARFYTDIIEA